MGADNGAWQGGHLSLEACRGGIENPVERSACQVVEPASPEPDIFRERPKTFSQDLCLAYRAVGNSDGCRLLGQEGLKDTPGGAASAENEDVFSRQGALVIEKDIAHQPRAIRVMSAQDVPVHVERVNRTGGLRFGCQPARKGMRILLEGYGDIGAFAAAGKKGLCCLVEMPRFRQQGGVLDGLAGLFGKQGMYQRRLAVADRVADDDITVHGISLVVSGVGKRG